MPLAASIPNTGKLAPDIASLIRATIHHRGANPTFIGNLLKQAGEFTGRKT